VPNKCAHCSSRRAAPRARGRSRPISRVHLAASRARSCSVWEPTAQGPTFTSLAPAGALRLHFASRSEPRRNGLTAVVTAPRGGGCALRAAGRALMELRWPSWLSRRSRSGRLSQLNPSAFQNSTLAELAWQRARHASTRWALWGAVVGVFVGLVLFAPASWLAYALSRASDQRLLLADAQGTVWNGSAQVVLTG